MSHGYGKSTHKCTTCQEELKLAVKLRVTAHLTKAVQTAYVVGTDFDKLLTPVFECPTCHEQFQIKARLVDIEVIKPDESTALSVLTPKQVETVRMVREKGLLDVFSAVVQEQFGKNGRVPNDFVSYFLNFMAGITRMNLTADVCRSFSQQFPPGPIEFYKGMGIGMIVSKGEVRSFLPMSAMDTRRSTSVVNAPFREESVRRTRMGMVPQGHKFFLIELMHSLGHRGHAVPAVPLRAQVLSR